MALPFIDVNQYLTEVTPTRDEVLTEMENYAHENRFPIVGPTSGSFLHQMVLLTRPKRIFEMGSGFGYSAYWMAKALKDPEAKINCTDGSMEVVSPIESIIRWETHWKLLTKQWVSSISSITTLIKIAIRKCFIKLYLVCGAEGFLLLTTCCGRDE